MRQAVLLLWPLPTAAESGASQPTRPKRTGSCLVRNVVSSHVVESPCRHSGRTDRQLFILHDDPFCNVFGDLISFFWKFLAAVVLHNPPALPSNRWRRDSSCKRGRRYYCPEPQRGQSASGGGRAARRSCVAGWRHVSASSGIT